MKQIKLFLLIVVAAVFGACSDDDDWNSKKDVTVGFSQSVYEIKESAGMVKIPFTITGERNGDIKVKIQYTDGTAISEGHYIVTSDEINIPADADSTDVFYVELRVIDDGTEENDDRQFTMDIVQLNGAEKAIDHCDVIITDVDKDPYFKLLGDYTVYAINAETGEEANFDVTLTNSDGYDDYSGVSFVVNGMYEQGTFDPTLPWLLGYDENGTVEISEYYFYAAYNFGSFLGAVSVIPFDLTAGPTEAWGGTYNKDFTEITFEEGTSIATGVYDYDSSTGNIDTDKYYGYMDVLVITKMVKKQ